ncbi:MAG: LysR family transcriptional regulator [Anaerolineales bacterium]
MKTKKLSAKLSDISMLDAHQLNIFLVAAETLNFTQAAERLHMSQPSVSQHIRALEKHFEEVLFIRQGRALILSDAGRILIPLAQQFVKQSIRINETMSSLKGHIKGRINIGCNAVSGKYVLPEFFAQFHNLYPEVTIRCQTDSCSSPLEDLRSSDLHFLITNQGKGLESCFEVHHFLTEEIQIIVPISHHWASRSSIDAAELFEEKFILPTENTDTYIQVNGALAASNLSLMQLDSFLSLSNAEAIVLSVQKGLGISFSSKIISSVMGNLISIPIKGAEITRDISIVRDKTQLSTAARDAFWEFMITVSEEIKQSASI